VAPKTPTPGYMNAVFQIAYAPGNLTAVARGADGVRLICGPLAFASCLGPSAQARATGAGGDHGIAKVWTRREISATAYYDQSHDLHSHP
jgi:hypothetical protein